NDLFCSVDGKTKAYCTPEEYEGVPGRFYHNDGDGTFTERTEQVGIGDGPGKTLGATILDYNRDGWMDLLVANDLARNQLFENDGDGTFTERGIRSGVGYSGNGTARAGMGVDVGVVDSTGEPTVFVGNFSREMIGVFRHRGDGLFVDRAAPSRVGRPSRLSLTFGLFLFDGELDGDLDLFVANGHVQPDIEEYSRVVDYRQPAQLFLNNGSGRFQPVQATRGPLATPLAARGAAYGDVDGDGDLDVLITENAGDAHLWRNDVRRSGDGPNYLRVALRGTESNRPAIGARIQVAWNDEREERLVRTGTSYLSSSERVATIGLGAATQVDRVAVAWPSGRTTRVTDVAANQTLRLVEGEGPSGGADSLRAQRSAPPNARSAP
ncbi:MAG: CRTAC1 family protein, partial [Salinibacter sp.]